MVQLMGYSHSEHVEDFVEEEEHGCPAKRSRLEAAPSSQLISCNNGFAVPPLYNPLDEPSPLGLRLRKSPSLLDLIQMRLSQGSSTHIPATANQASVSGRKKDAKANTASNANDKLKASNFPASVLRIGNWEYVSAYEGDLVAKCYFAKHKIVWEVLSDGLKSKIEIQWSDITALKADLPDTGPGSLAIVLARKPIFFRETNPQPRKHTLWQASSDFTNGQASVNLKHYIECPHGVLNKHYEKLVQCDVRLYMLSQQPELVTGSPYLESQASVPENSEESKGDGSDQMPTAKESSISVCQDMTSSAGTHFSSFMSGQSPLPAQPLSEELSSPSSAMDMQTVESSRASDGQQNSFEQNSAESSKVQGLHLSMSMNDLVNHLESCISEQMNSGILPSDKALECQDMLENISQVLLCDTPRATGLDEKSLMKKVDSLCCLLQDPGIASSAQGHGEDYSFGIAAGHGKNISNDFKTDTTVQGHEGNFKDGLGFKQPPSIPRRDSLGDLLFHLPRIASLPKFPKLFGISEDDEYRGM